jgi:hypothetical protein
MTMKTARKPIARRRVGRRQAPLSLSARIERLEKAVLFPVVAPFASAAGRFVNLGADGKPATSNHVAVFDRDMKLVWLAEPLQAGKEMAHADALKACTELDLMGFKDWRAPTIRELLSLVDYDRYDPAVDPAHFKGPYGWTWSSTLAKAPSGDAWYVSLGSGDSSRDSVDLPYHVRAVRAGQQLGLLA